MASILDLLTGKPQHDSKGQATFDALSAECKASVVEAAGTLTKLNPTDVGAAVFGDARCDGHEITNVATAVRLVDNIQKGQINTGKQSPSR